MVERWASLHARQPVPSGGARQHPTLPSRSQRRGRVDASTRTRHHSTHPPRGLGLRSVRPAPRRVGRIRYGSHQQIFCQNSPVHWRNLDILRVRVAPWIPNLRPSMLLLPIRAILHHSRFYGFLHGDQDSTWPHAAGRSSRGRRSIDFSLASRGYLGPSAQQLARPDTMSLA